MIVPVEKLKSYEDSLSKNAISKHFELFYAFRSLKQETHNQCNLCKQSIDCTIEKHVILYCIKLRAMRMRFWGIAQNNLAKLFDKPGNCYSMEYSINVMKVISKHKDKQEKLWRLFAGANCWKTPHRNSPKGTKKDFNYRNKWKKILKPKFKFNWNLFAILAKWTSLAKSMYKTPNTIRKHLKKYKYKLMNLWFPRIIKNNKQLKHFYKSIDVNKNDIIVFTDGSFKEQNEIGFKYAAGAGIVIFHNDIRYHYAKGMGNNEILYAEQFPINQLILLLNKLKINIRNKRILLFTDSKASFDEIWTDNKYPTFPSLMSDIRKNLFTQHETKILLNKVKAHTEEPIMGNFYADECANKGRDISTFTWTGTPSRPSDFEWSTAHYYSGCSAKMLLWDFSHPGVD